MSKSQKIRFLILLLFTVYLLPVSAYGQGYFNSGAPTENVELAVRDFTRNGTEHAEAAKLLGKPNLSTPARAAATQMRAAALSIQTRKGFQVFGEAMLDATSKALKLHPGGKGLGEAADLIKKWSESTDIKDFAKKVASGKAKSKAGDLAKDIGGESAKKLTENIYGELEKTIAKAKDIELKATLKGVKECSNGNVKYKAVVSLKNRTIKVSLDGNCKCPTNKGIKSYGGLLIGKVVFYLKDKKLLFKFLGTGMRFSGQRCGSAKPVEKSYGALRKPNTITVKKESGIKCTRKDCEGLISKMKERDHEIKVLKKEMQILKGIDPNSNRIPVLEQAIGQHIAQLEQLCKYWNDCGCDSKIDKNFMSPKTKTGKKNRSLYRKICVDIKKYGDKRRHRLLGPSRYVRREDSPFLPNIGFSYFHLENFEDHKLDTPGITISNGDLSSNLYDAELFDSVDADDGSVDGKTTNGDSWWASGKISISFNPIKLRPRRYPTHVGLVWTDGGGTITFEAFDAQGELLGSRSGNHADGSHTGGTAEDRFYGVIYKGGISKVTIDNGGGIEIDHIQYGAAQRNKK